MNEKTSAIPLILTAVGTIIVTVVTLEYYGYIKHSSDADRRQTGVYRSILMEPGQEFKMSNKPADTVAYCHQGFMAMSFRHNGKPAGILVDEKDRGIRCRTLASAPGQPAH